jgi:hypothetical protein
MLLRATSQEMPSDAVNSRIGDNRASGSGMNQGAKKKFVVTSYDDRTVNRHRWMGRESQGVRGNVRSGTRQKSGRTFGIWPDLFGMPIYWYV